MLSTLQGHSRIFVRQRRELAELMGFEARNKYSIEDEGGTQLGFAAEQQKTLFGFVLRQNLGHWRRFDLTVFDAQRRPVARAHHPFRFLFQRLEVSHADSGGPIGAVQQRFAILHKRFSLHGADGAERFEIRSKLWRIWTFPIFKGDRQVACITKRWGGVVKEAFLDADTFEVVFDDPALAAEDRLVILSAALLVDLQYFEKKAD